MVVMLIYKHRVDFGGEDGRIDGIFSGDGFGMVSSTA